jgi:hypothetical protein
MIRIRDAHQKKLRILRNRILNTGIWNDPDPEVGFPKKRDLPEVPGEEGEEKLPYDEEIFDDNTAEDALAPTYKLNGQHEGGLENARLKINKNV